MKALVAMSGGVDSSVAAAMMLERGYDVIGVTLKQWEGPDGEMPTAGCCTVGDAEDARRAAAQLDIPYYVLDYVDEFTEKVVRRFGEIYMQGRTPNPCIECNRTVRFQALLDRTTELGCDVLVTGHHARVTRDDDGFHLRKGKDPGKDQSYVLHMLGQDELSRIHLPIGEVTKAEVRDQARNLGLRTADKPDSQDLCFVTEGDYRSFLREHFPDTAIPGKIVTMEGEVVGDHAGTIDFTIGQRKGLGIAVGEPRYVVDIEPTTAVVTIGRRADLRADGCRVEGLTFTSGMPPTDLSVAVKIRYRSDPIDATLDLSGTQAEVRFASPQIGVAPGQAAVLYRGDEVLGGGTITSAL
jgi:tRNA-uridine 2-sulfurtransferase